LAGLDRVEYRLQIDQFPSVLKRGHSATLVFRVFNAETGEQAKNFELVHEKTMHVFLVSENLEFFSHVHPVQQSDGSFRLPIQLPMGGMYRLLADFYPSGSVPQLTVKTLYAAGQSHAAKLAQSIDPFRSENLTSSLRLEPEQALAGMETKLFFKL